MSGSEALKVSAPWLFLFSSLAALGRALLWLGSSSSPSSEAYLLLHSGLALCVALVWTKSRYNSVKVVLRQEIEPFGCKPKRHLRDRYPLSANWAYHNGVGYDEGLGWFQCSGLDAEEDRNDVMASLARTGSRQAILHPYWTRNVTKSGQIIDCSIAWKRKRSATGVVTGFVSMITDITARRKAEERLKDSEATTAPSLNNLATLSPHRHT